MKSSDVLARKRALLARIQTEGAEAAYDAALAVCKDKAAPAPARATCATTLLRAGGFLNAKDEGATREPHEMTSEEISAQLAELRSARLASSEAADPDGPEAFG